MLALAALALGEAGLRVLGSGIFDFVHAARQVHAYSPRSRVDLRPDAAAHLRLSGGDGRLIYNFPITTDRFGLRTWDRPIDHPAPGEPAAGVRWIHCVGDSFTMGWGLAYADSFPARLDWLLPADVRVLNLGVDGFGTLAATEKSEKLWPLLPAVHAIYLFHPGDFADDARALRLRRGPTFLHPLRRGLDAARRRTYLANVPFALAWHARFRDLRGSRDAATRKLQFEDAVDVEALVLEPDVQGVVLEAAHPSLNRLRAYRDFVEARGARLTVLVPFLEEPAARAAYVFCRLEGIEVYALDFQDDLLLRRDGHLSRLGAHTLARFVRERVLSVPAPDDGGTPTAGRAQGATKPSGRAPTTGS